MVARNSALVCSSVQEPPFLKEFEVMRALLAVRGKLILALCGLCKTSRSEAVLAQVRYLRSRSPALCAGENHALLMQPISAEVASQQSTETGLRRRGNESSVRSGRRNLYQSPCELTTLFPMDDFDLPFLDDPRWRGLACALTAQQYLDSRCRNGSSAPRLFP